MILGLSLDTFTFLHVVASLVGIMTGFVLVALMLHSAPLAGWNGFFLVSTAWTSISGFLFPTPMLVAAHVLGAISLVALAAASLAIYGRRLAGRWRSTYVVGALVALYLNTFVCIVQLFDKFAYLNRLAPTATELPYVLAQVVVLVVFIVAGVAAVRRYRPLP